MIGLRIGCITMMALWIGGCCAQPAAPHPATSLPSTQPAASTRPVEAFLPAAYSLAAVEAMIDPPIGWRQDKFLVDARHTHVVWLSPTGDTAYGVVLIHLPFPAPTELVLLGFLKEMARTDRFANLLVKTLAPDLPGLRFVAEGEKYKIRVNLAVRTWKAWAIYAGTLQSRPDNIEELKIAEAARDRTIIDPK